MRVWQRQLAVLVLLLLPLQGLAASLAAYTCHSGTTEHATSNAHADDHGTSQTSHTHDDAAPHQHDGDAGGDRSGTLSCHHVFSGMPAAMALTRPAELPDFESSISLFSTLFVPELPQRPPRA